jgi:hypothetical protein
LPHLASDIMTFFTVRVKWRRRAAMKKGSPAREKHIKSKNSQGAGDGYLTSQGGAAVLRNKRILR